MLEDNEGSFATRLRTFYKAQMQRTYNDNLNDLLRTILKNHEPQDLESFHHALQNMELGAVVSSTETRITPHFATDKAPQNAELAARYCQEACDALVNELQILGVNDAKTLNGTVTCDSHRLHLAVEAYQPYLGEFEMHELTHSGAVAK